MRNFALAFGKGASHGARRRSRGDVAESAAKKTSRKILRSRKLSVTLQNLSGKKKRRRSGGSPQPGTEDTETITIDKRDEVVQEPQGASPAGLVNYRVRQVDILNEYEDTVLPPGQTRNLRKSFFQKIYQQRRV